MRLCLSGYRQTFFKSLLLLQFFLGFLQYSAHMICVPICNICVTTGHNFGSLHDNSDECVPSGSKGGKYLMYPYAVSGLDGNNKVFYACF